MLRCRIPVAFVVTILSIFVVSTALAQSGIDAPLAAKLIVDVPDVVNEGETFQVSVAVENIEDLAGFQVDLKYTAGALQCQSGMIKGTFLGNNVYWMDPMIDNQLGLASGAICVRTKQGGMDGNGALFALTFKADHASTATVVAKNVILLDSNAQEIPVSVIGATLEIRAYPPWDVNQDGVVNVVDLLIVALRLNEYVSGNPVPNPDVNRSGRVTVTDLVLVAQHFGETYNTGAPGKEKLLSAEEIGLLRGIRAIVAAMDEPDEATLHVLDGLLGYAPKTKCVTWSSIRRKQ